MPITNKMKMILFVSLLSKFYVSYAEVVTVEDAINAAKQKKSQSAVAKSDSLPASLYSSQMALGSSGTQPKLWSIRGVNNHYTAEVIYQNKIFHIPLKNGEIFEKWEIVNFSSDTVSLIERKDKYTNQSKSRSSNMVTPKVIVLNTPANGYSIAEYRLSTDLSLNNNLQRRIAADLPMANPLPPKDKN